MWNGESRVSEAALAYALSLAESDCDTAPVNGGQKKTASWSQGRQDSSRGKGNTWKEEYNSMLQESLLETDESSVSATSQGLHGGVPEAGTTRTSEGNRKLGPSTHVRSNLYHVLPVYRPEDPPNSPHESLILPGHMHDMVELRDEDTGESRIVPRHVAIRMGGELCASPDTTDSMTSKQEQGFLPHSLQKVKEVQPVPVTQLKLRTPPEPPPRSSHNALPVAIKSDKDRELQLTRRLPADHQWQQQLTSPFKHPNIYPPECRLAPYIEFVKSSRLKTKNFPEENVEHDIESVASSGRSSVSSASHLVHYMPEVQEDSTRKVRDDAKVQGPADEQPSKPSSRLSKNEKRAMLNSMSLMELKSLASCSSVDLQQCVEKSEMIDALIMGSVDIGESQYQLNSGKGVSRDGVHVLSTDEVLEADSGPPEIERTADSSPHAASYPHFTMSFEHLPHKTLQMPDTDGPWNGVANENPERSDISVPQNTHQTANLPDDKSMHDLVELYDEKSGQTALVSRHVAIQMGGHLDQSGGESAEREDEINCENDHNLSGSDWPQDAFSPQAAMHGALDVEDRPGPIQRIGNQKLSFFRNIKSAMSELKEQVWMMASNKAAARREILEIRASARLYATANGHQSGTAITSQAREEKLKMLEEFVKEIEKHEQKLSANTTRADVIDEDDVKDALLLLREENKMLRKLLLESYENMHICCNELAEGSKELEDLQEYAHMQQRERSNMSEALLRAGNKAEDFKKQVDQAEFKLGKAVSKLDEFEVRHQGLQRELDQTRERCENTQIELEKTRVEAATARAEASAAEISKTVAEDLRRQLLNLRQSMDLRQSKDSNVSEDSGTTATKRAAADARGLSSGSAKTSPQGPQKQKPSIQHHDISLFAIHPAQIKSNQLPQVRQSPVAQHLQMQSTIKRQPDTRQSKIQQTTPSRTPRTMHALHRAQNVPITYMQVGNEIDPTHQKPQQSHPPHIQQTADSLPFGVERRKADKGKDDSNPVRRAIFMTDGNLANMIGEAV